MRGGGVEFGGKPRSSVNCRGRSRGPNARRRPLPRRMKKPVSGPALSGLAPTTPSPAARIGITRPLDGSAPSFSVVIPGCAHSSPGIILNVNMREHRPLVVHEDQILCAAELRVKLLLQKASHKS